LDSAIKADMNTDSPDGKTRWRCCRVEIHGFTHLLGIGNYNPGTPDKATPSPAAATGVPLLFL
jgi:hypothetical protein